jgi:hypothetical protein
MHHLCVEPATRFHPSMFQKYCLLFDCVNENIIKCDGSNFLKRTIYEHLTFNPFNVNVNKAFWMIIMYN